MDKYGIYSYIAMSLCFVNAVTVLLYVALFIVIIAVNIVCNLLHIFIMVEVLTFGSDYL